MQAHDGTEKHTPHHPFPATKSKKDEAGQGDWDPVPFTDEGMELVFAKIRNVGQESVRVVVHNAARNDPAHVCPEPAIAR